jgi:hypothetical protein
MDSCRSTRKRRRKTSCTKSATSGGIAQASSKVATQPPTVVGRDLRNEGLLVVRRQNYLGKTLVSGIKARKEEKRISQYAVLLRLRLRFAQRIWPHCVKNSPLAAVAPDCGIGLCLSESRHI